ncbi:MAG: DEAD/DEAH box helicase [Coriobacteriaceae bacterium]|nr:DEAD/DEAH box helicase [Coriobacteriaceae bacterium]
MTDKMQEDLDMDSFDEAEGVQEPAGQDERVLFCDLGLSDEVLAATEDLGYEGATPIQAAAIPEVLAGRDLLAAAQTGTGKTAAFLLPTMSKLPRIKRTRGRGPAVGCGPHMLVITPTRELAQQIDSCCKKIAARTRHTAVTVVGGVSYNPQKSALKRGCDILVATPGRLVDLIEQGACMLDEVQVLVLDEADRMLDMGFLPAVRQIVRQLPEDRQTLLFSATLDDKAVGSITDLVKNPARVEIAPVTSTADTVQQYVLPVDMDEKNGVLIDILKKYGTERVIVFTRTKRRADTCCRRLARNDISCAAIHGDRSQAQRERALRAFRQGRCDVLVATDVLARGIDVTDVRYVVNFDVPEEPVDYIHRIGRTGRAGEEGWAVTIVTKQDVAEFYDIEALMGKTADLMNPEGLTLGSNLPFVDPDRVPAKKPAGKKEKRRRKQAPKGSGNGSRGGRGRGDRRDDNRGERSRRSDASFEEPRSKYIPRGEDAPKPSRRKRGGKTRVREDESARFEERDERRGRDERSYNQYGDWHEDRRSRDNRRDDRRDDRRRDDRRGGRDFDEKRSRADRDERGSRSDRSRRDERRDERGGRRKGDSFRGGNGRGRSDRASYGSNDRPYVDRGEFVRSKPRDGKDTWRNYDEPNERYRGGNRNGGARRGNGGDYRPGRGGASRGNGGNRNGGSRNGGNRGNGRGARKPGDRGRR